MRTTSSVESLNSKLNQKCPKRGNIFDFIKSLQLFEFGKAYDMRRLFSFVPKRQMQRKRKVDRVRDEKIKVHSAALKKNEITVAQFLDLMAQDLVIANGTY